MSEDKIALARRLVKRDRGLKDLPKPTHAQVLNLAANLTAAELLEMLDEAGCHTAPNGDCVSEEPCIHTPQIGDDKGAAAARFIAGALQKGLSDLKLTTPVTHVSADWDDIVTRLPVKRSIVKKQPYGRILFSYRTANGRVRALHATRGWRETRA